MFDSFLRTHTLQTELIIPPDQLHDTRKYVWNKLIDFEKQIVSKEYGYLTHVVKIVDINCNSIYLPSYNCSITAIVRFEGVCINPQVDDCIETLMKFRNGVLFTINEPLYIMIRPSSIPEQFKFNETTKFNLKVVGTETNVERNLIKVLVDLIEIHEEPHYSMS